MTGTVKLTRSQTTASRKMSLINMITLTSIALISALLFLGFLTYPAIFIRVIGCSLICISVPLLRERSQTAADSNYTSLSTVSDRR